MVFCSPLEPMWDITIHPLQGKRPRWHSFLPPIDVGPPPNPPDARRRFPHTYKWCFVLLLNQCGTSQSTPFRASVLAGTLSFLQSMWDRHQIHPLRDSASLLAHRVVSGFDTICNNLGPPLANIVLFELSLSDFLSIL